MKIIINVLRDIIRDGLKFSIDLIFLVFIVFPIVLMTSGTPVFIFNLIFDYYFVEFFFNNVDEKWITGSSTLVAINFLFLTGVISCMIYAIIGIMMLPILIFLDRVKKEKERMKKNESGRS